MTNNHDNSSLAESAIFRLSYLLILLIAHSNKYICLFNIAMPSWCQLRLSVLHMYIKNAS